MLLTPRIVRTHELSQQRRQPDLRRHPAEPRPRRTAAGHRAGSGAAPAAAAAAPAGAAPARSPRRRRPAGAGQAAAVPSPTPAPTPAGAHAGRTGREQPRGHAGPDARSSRRFGRRSDRGVTALCRIPGRRRPVHPADLGHRRVAAVVDVADDHLQPGGGPRANGAGGELHALGRRAGHLHQPRRRRRGPRRHRHRAPGDTTGVAGTGLLAALVLDAVGAGPANIQVTGTGAAPGGGPISLQFAPVTAVTAR